MTQPTHEPPLSSQDTEMSVNGGPLKTLSSPPIESPSKPIPNLPPARGRPRSTSISNGSPSPVSGASIPLPTLISASPIGPTPIPWSFGSPSTAATPSTNGSGSPNGFPTNGWGHRASLSVPGIVSPVPVGPGSVARGGRHRRTQSVSPPGFPVLSEGDASGFAPSAPSASSNESAPPPSSTAMPMPTSARARRENGRSMSPSGSPLDVHIRRDPGKTRSPTQPHFSHHSSSPTSGSPRNKSHFSPSTSPTGHSFLHHSHSGPHHGHAASHAALLTGIRSHALPHSPTLSATTASEDAEVHRRASSRSPAPVSPSSSPPFGPTTSTSVLELHRPSPLALELRHESPEEDLQAVLRSGGLGFGEDRSGFDASHFDRSGAVSPPLLPLPCSQPSGGRARAGSIGRDRVNVSSPSTLASQYLETEVPSPVGQVDVRMTPEEQHRSSPPPPCHQSQSMALFPPSPAASALSRSPSLSPGSYSSGLALGFADLPATSSIDMLSPPQTTLSATPNFDPAAPATSAAPPPPPVGVVDGCFPDSSFPEDAASTSPISSPSANSSVAVLDLLPPPSPHRSNISLPLPLVAPTPLPAHLGGPQLLSHHQPRHKPRSSSGGAAASGTGAAPKKHSPLASPAISGDEDSGDEDDREMETEGKQEKKDEPASQQEQPIEGASESRDRHSTPPQEEKVDEARVAAALLEAEATEMDLGVPADSSPAASDDASSKQASQPTSMSPPRSGWDMDESSEDELDEGFASSSPPITGRLAEADVAGDLALTRMTCPPSPPTTVAPSALSLSLSMSASRDAEVPQLRTFDSDIPQPQSAHLLQSMPSPFGAMDVDPAAVCSVAAGSETVTSDITGSSPFDLDDQQDIEAAVDEGGDTSHDSQSDMIAIDEESLSALEKIFICAKSDHADERARVARHLADWLVGVDICEAAEYVLPLLCGLATDQEDLVKEMFAPQLDRIMWHFFSQCPLSELDASPTANASPIGSPVPSRYVALHRDAAEPSPTSTHFVSDDSGSVATPPTTSKTTPTNTEADVPRISATAFTSLLGALLTDQSSVVAKATEAALVRFLCLLKGRPPPPVLESPMSSPMSANLDDTLKLTTEVSTHHSSYQLGPEATQILEDEFITGIVLGLARLEEDDKEHDKHMEDGDRSQRDGSQSDRSRTPQTDGKTLCASPEEDRLEDAWLSGPEPFVHPFENLPSDDGGWGAPLSSFFDDGLDRSAASDVERGVSPLGQSSEYPNFPPDDKNEEEAAIGKLVSMSLIGAIAAAECLDMEVLVEQILPEVERMKGDQTFYVRKEAAQALGSLAKSLPVSVLESVVLPLHSAFSQDQLWHVRRAACLVLPAICKQLPSLRQRSQAVDLIKAFNGDSSPHVRSGALEVCGELTYMFHGDPDGVPEEILAIFLGQSDQSAVKPAGSAAASKQDDDDDAFAPLQNALDSPPDAFLDNAKDWRPSAASARDPDRPVMCAFNFPAVALTLGGDRWDALRTYHHTLCQDEVPKVRQSLASSLHEIAKIIGPDKSDECLLEPFSWYIRDFDHIQGAVLENLPTLLQSFGIETAQKALTMLGEEWPEIKTWRRREALAKQMGELSATFMTAASGHSLLHVLSRALNDSVAAVREQAVLAIPAVFSATADDPTLRKQVQAFLSLFKSNALNYRARMVYVSCALALVRAGITREHFEADLLWPLSELARDRVVNVQISVARVIGEACRTSALYQDPSNRLPLYDILTSLSHSPDRDVRSHIVDFYVADLDSPVSSPRIADTHRILPTAVRTNPHAHGISSDDDEDDDDVNMLDGSGSKAGEGELEGEDASMLDEWDDEYVLA